MGMAASQARYLSLTARKSNVEYEGQQINQARTSLANQSANLFNQMLDMKVPTPPSKTDFTTLQYSFSDGVNTEVLSNYYQLGNKDSDYNYVVTTYHNEKVYTGSRKKMNDPQVQAAFVNNYSYDLTSVDNNQTKAVTKAIANADGTYLLQTSDGITKVFRKVNTNEQEEVKKAQAIVDGGGGDIGTKTANKTVNVALTDATIKDDFEQCSVIGDDNQIKDDLGFLTDQYPGSIDLDDYYRNSEGVYITKSEYDAGADISDGMKIEYTPPADPAAELYTDGNTFITKSELDDAVQIYNDNVEHHTHNPNNVKYMTTTATPDLSSVVYTSVGNCALTEVKPEEYLNDPDLKTEIDQIIKDMKGPNGDITAAQNFAQCFEKDPTTGDLVYKGGIFSFTMGGTKYFTTKNDLDTSLPTSIVDNGIDVQQQKLRYYNAVYLDTRVEDTQKALLETDGKGRFKSMKLENDNIVYTLNAEETTDDAAYNDAMNRYYYENAEYEKKLADINAKTEVIHAQDRTLELRLEQLQTEQSALQNEMEAVKKVVDKHVELGFKTFGG